MTSHSAELAPYLHLLAPPAPAALNLVAALAGAPPAAILELGSGVGERCAALNQRGYDCFGVELDYELHRRALKRHPALAPPPEGNGRLIQGDPLEVFDLVRPPLKLAFSAGALDGGALARLSSLEDAGSVLAQLWDLTRPGGRVLLVLPNIEHLMAEAARVRAAAQEPGDEPEYVDLAAPEPRRGSPQLGSITVDEIRLYLPPVSVSSEVGMVELERQYILPLERRGDGSDYAGESGPALRERLYLRMQLRVPEGEHEPETIWELPLLKLDRATVEDLLREHVPAALATAQWFSGFESEPWSAEQALSVLVLG